MKKISKLLSLFLLSISITACSGASGDFWMHDAEEGTGIHILGQDTDIKIKQISETNYKVTMVKVKTIDDQILTFSVNSIVVFYKGDCPLKHTQNN